MLQIEHYEQVFNNISLGDSLLAHGSYEMAEQRYQEAKKDVSAIYFAEGKQQALDALEKLYAEWSAAKEESEEQSAEQAADEKDCRAFLKMGTLQGVNEKTGESIRFKIEPSDKLEKKHEVYIINLTGTIGIIGYGSVGV